MAKLDALFATLQMRARDEAGYGRQTTLSTDQTNRIQEAIDDAYREIAGAFSWAWLRPWTTIVAWPTVTGTVSGLPVHNAGYSTVTATAAKFYEGMVGRTFTFDDSDTGYTIYSYTSTTVITLTGNASAEKSGDTFSIASTGDYYLPSTFGGMVGKELMIDSSTTQYGPIEKVVQSFIERQRSLQPTWTGIPRYWSTRWRTETSSAAQRQELMLFPTPDAAYTINYQYEHYVDQLSSNNYPPGAQAYSDLFIKGVLAAIDRNLNGRQGGRQMDFDRALTLAVDREKRDQSGFQGYYSDKKQSRGQASPRVLYTTVDGVRY